MNLSELENRLREHAQIAKSTVTAPFDIESEELYMSKKKLIGRTLALAAAVICIIGTTAFAAVHFLSPSEVAKQVGYESLAEIMEDNGGLCDIPAQQSGDYEFQILGITSGANLSNFTEVNENRSYIVGAISRIDGGKLADYPGVQMSPLISGYEPWRVNIFTLDGGKSEFIDDNDTVDYFVYECDDIEVFADRTVYIAFYEGIAPSSDIFKLNSNGSIEFNEGYIGIKALFEIPLDKSKADPEKAEEYIKSLQNDKSSGDEINDIAENGDAEEVEEYVIGEDLTVTKK